MDRMHLCLIIAIVATFTISLVFASGCLHQGRQLRIATTTSLYDTGLLDRLEDVYEAEMGSDLWITSQGSGKAMELARRGDVDLLLVHSPVEEEAFISSGDGLLHRCFAYNRFLLLGPPEDPAGVIGLGAREAFSRIRTLGESGAAGIVFVSRGDGSGTHNAELRVWSAAGLDQGRISEHEGRWYIETGKGMGESLLIASEKGAYILADAGTYHAYRSNLRLIPILSGDEELLNRYSAIMVNPSRHPHVNAGEAERFVNWLLSEEGGEILATYGVEEYGAALFTPLVEGVCEEPPFHCSCSPVTLQEVRTRSSI